MNERGREGASYEEYFRVLRFARQGFPCVYDVLDNEEHGFMFVLTLRRLRCHLFVYSRWKNFCRRVSTRFSARFLP